MRYDEKTSKNHDKEICRVLNMSDDTKGVSLNGSVLETISYHVPIRVDLSATNPQYALYEVMRQAYVAGVNAGKKEAQRDLRRLCGLEEDE